MRPRGQHRTKEAEHRSKETARQHYHSIGIQLHSVVSMRRLIPTYRDSTLLASCQEVARVLRNEVQYTSKQEVKPTTREQRQSEMFELVSSLASFSRLTGNSDDDWTDRMSHLWTVVLLGLFAVVVTTSQFVGNAIECWIPGGR
ncbi:hypothetical protein ScPMuIL_016867 [Solemya velum]